MKKKIIYSILSVLLLTTAVIVWLYFSNKLGVFGLCKPGAELRKPINNNFYECYMPNPNLGLPCKKRSDCGGIDCIANNLPSNSENQINNSNLTGICRDFEYQKSGGFFCYLEDNIDADKIPCAFVDPI